jgi:NADPH-dependent curcumin reductase CurA
MSSALYLLTHCTCVSTQAFGTIAIQLAHHRGAKVISTACSLEDKQCLERLRPSIGG